MGLSTWSLRVTTVLDEKKENIIFCFVVSNEVSVVIDFDGVTVLFLFSLIGRCICSTVSAHITNGSGGVCLFGRYYLVVFFRCFYVSYL